MTQFMIYCSKNIIFKTINVSEIKKIIGENGLVEQKEVLSYNYKTYDKKEYKFFILIY